MEEGLYTMEKDLAKSRLVGCLWKVVYAMYQGWYCWITKESQGLHISRNEVTDGLPN